MAGDTGKQSLVVREISVDAIEYCQPDAARLDLDQYLVLPGGRARELLPEGLGTPTVDAISGLHAGHEEGLSMRHLDMRHEREARSW